MNFLIVLSFVVAASASGIYDAPYAAPIVAPVYRHEYPIQHLPVIDPVLGVPIDTPEVQAAKTLHFGVHAARTGLLTPVAPYVPAPIYETPAIAEFPIAKTYVTPAVAPIAKTYVSPAPVYGPPAIAAEYPLAKTYVSHAVAPLGHYDVLGNHFGSLRHLRKRRSAYAYEAPVAARLIAPVAASLFRHEYPIQHIPVIDPVLGVPLDTPEVQSAKAFHFTAHAAAIARNGYAAPYAYGRYDAPWSYGRYDAPLAYGRFNAPLAYGHY